VPSPEKRDYF